MATTSTIKLTTQFADDTKREVELGSFDSSVTVASTVRGKVREFNANIQDLEGLYLSSGGADCTGITNASIITVTERKINLNEN